MQFTPIIIPLLNFTFTTIFTHCKLKFTIYQNFSGTVVLRIVGYVDGINIVFILFRKNSQNLLVSIAVAHLTVLELQPRLISFAALGCSNNCHRKVAQNNK